MGRGGGAGWGGRGGRGGGLGRGGAAALACSFPWLQLPLAGVHPRGRQGMLHLRRDKRGSLLVTRDNRKGGGLVFG